MMCEGLLLRWRQSPLRLWFAFGLGLMEGVLQNDVFGFEMDGQLQRQLVLSG